MTAMNALMPLMASASEWLVFVLIVMFVLQEHILQTKYSGYAALVGNGMFILLTIFLTEIGIANKS